MGNGIKLFLGALFALSALILAIVACAGSTKNYVPLNKIYVARVDLSSANLAVLLPGSSYPSGTVNSIPQYINVGLWSYCAVEADGDVQWCSSPRAILDYDLQDFIYSSIQHEQHDDRNDDDDDDDDDDDGGLNGVSLSESDISVPVLESMGKFRGLVKCMFITLIIGIVITFLNLVTNLLRWIIHVRFLKWVGTLLSFLGFTALLVSAGTGTGAYVWLKRELFDKDDTWAISMKLGATFFGLLWGAVVAALLNLIAWCSVRSRPKLAYALPVEKMPLM